MCLAEPPGRIICKSTPNRERPCRTCWFRTNRGERPPKKKYNMNFRESLCSGTRQTPLGTMSPGVDRKSNSCFCKCPTNSLSAIVSILLQGLHLLYVLIFSRNENFNASEERRIVSVKKYNHGPDAGNLILVQCPRKSESEWRPNNSTVNVSSACPRHCGLVVKMRRRI